MARVKYWGLPVVRDTESGVLISMRLDKMFVITKKAGTKEEKIALFHPADILDEKEKSLEKKFKKYVAGYTDERLHITPDVKIYLSKMEQRLKK